MNIRLMILIIIGILFSIQSCDYRLTTKASAFNDSYHVIARSQSSDATTPNVMAISVAESGYEDDDWKGLVRRIGQCCKAELGILPNNILFASLAWGECYLTDLDCEDCEEIEIWEQSEDTWREYKAELRELSIVDSAGEEIGYMFRFSDDPSIYKFTIHGSEDWGLRLANIYVLYCNKPVIKYSGPDKIIMDIPWMSGKISKDICIDIGKGERYVVLNPCPNNADQGKSVRH